MRRRWWTFLLLVAACVLLLPAVYHVVRRDAAFVAPLALSPGLLSMGLAWSGGCALENRRRGTVRAIAGLGVALPLLVLAPFFPEPFLASERAALLATAATSAAALALLLRTPRAK